jgi:hypothetical protein
MNVNASGHPAIHRRKNQVNKAGTRWVELGFLSGTPGKRTALKNGFTLNA